MSGLHLKPRLRILRILWSLGMGPKLTDAPWTSYNEIDLMIYDTEH